MSSYSHSSDPAIVMPSLLPAAELPARQGVFAFLSNIERNGHWLLPRAFRTLSIFGSVTLDLTQVRLGAHTDIEIRCFMGNVEVIVPPGVRLECDGDATIGNFEVNRRVPSATSPDAPSVHIKAGVLLGNIEITVLDPNAKTFLQKVKARWKLRDTNPD